MASRALPLLSRARVTLIDGCARAGEFTLGGIYTLIGVLALQLAFGVRGGKATDADGAFVFLTRAHSGVLLLALICAGLLALVAWRWSQAFLDTERKGKTGRGLVRRTVYFLSGGFYLMLALSSGGLLLGHARHHSPGAKGWAARAMEKPLGTAGVGAVAIGLLIYAAFQLREVFQARFREHLKLGALSGNQQHWVVQVSRVGLLARTVVFLVMGGYLLRASIDADPREAKGLGEALGAVFHRRSGALLLGLVASGLLAYAFHLFVLARYRRVSTSTPSRR